MKEVDIQSMSSGEKIKAIEALWGSLLNEENELTSPEWHKEILQQRKKVIEDGEASFLSLEKLREYHKNDQ